MSEDMLTQIQRDLLDIKRRLSRLESSDKSAVTEWTQWTPILYGATTAGTFTYTQQEAWYFVLDNTVFVYGRVQINAVTVAAAGATRIGPMPFSVAGANNNEASFTIQARINLDAGYTMYSANVNNDFIAIVQTGDNLLANFPAANLAANDQIRFAGFFRIA